LSEGYEQRITLYQLYHVLNHLNLFGAGYLGRAQAMIAELLRMVAQGGGSSDSSTT
jgi:fructosamine-3-kinase